MDSEMVRSIVEEFKDAFDDKRPREIDIRPEAVRRVVGDMAKHGYEPSPMSVKAVEQYLKGYGLYLCGKVGTGKTMFFRAVSPLPVAVRQTGEPPKIVVLPMSQTIGMSVEDIRDWLQDNRYNEVVFDDIGSEPVFNWYGEKFEILPYMIEKRMFDSPCRTHATGNLLPKDIAARYGVRVVDRFAEMFSIVEFTGRSRRRAEPNRGIRDEQDAVIRRRNAGNGVGIAALPGYGTAESISSGKIRPEDASGGAGQ